MKILSFLLISCYMGIALPAIAQQSQQTVIGSSDTVKIVLSTEFKKVENGSPEFIRDTIRTQLKAKSSKMSGISQSSSLSSATIDAGRMSGSVDVSPNGAATYTVPLNLPPGIGEHLPNISVIYNSQSGNGLLGLGWSVSGLSSITRVSGTKFHDGRIDGVNFDQKDRYALDGQRLLLKSGSYGGDGAEYQTESHNNIRIISHGVSPYGAGYGPEYFEVLYPDGSKAFYGIDTNSRNKTDFAIAYRDNPLGVRIRYSYTHLDDSMYIEQISYGAVGSSLGMNSISFNYTIGTRPEQNYVGGHSIYRNRIISGINVLANGTYFRIYTMTYDQVPGLNYQRLTSIQESNGDGTKALAPIYFTYGTSGNLITTNFIGNLSLTGIAGNNSEIITSDFTGNGSMDFLLYPKNNKDKFYAFYDMEPGSPYFQMGYQVNTGAFRELFAATSLSWNNKILPGQGMMTVKDNGANAYKFEVYSSGTTAPVYYQYDRTWNDVPVSSGYYSDCDHQFHDGPAVDFKFVSGDFNGDGLTDVMAVGHSQQVVFYEYPNQTNPNDPGGGGGIEQPPVGTIDGCIKEYAQSGSPVYLINMDRRITTDYVTGLGAIYPYFEYGDQLYTSDFNGDGKTDILLVKPGQMAVFTVSEYNYLALLWSHSDGRITNNWPMLLGDYNGDGKTDVMFSTGNNSLFATFMSTGKAFIKFEQYQPFSNAAGTWNGSGPGTLNLYYLLANDVDGDGKSDIVAAQTTTYNTSSEGKVYVNVYHNSGPSGNQQPNFSAGASSNWRRTNLRHYPIPIFLNPNRQNYKLEFGFLSDNSISLFRFGKDYRNESQVASISHDGIYHTIAYKELSASQAFGELSYQISYDQVYPYVDLHNVPGMSVVGEISRSYGDGQLKQIFGYGKAVSHVDGLGFLGFGELIRSNWNTGYDDPKRIFSIDIQDPQLRGANIRSFTSRSAYINPSIKDLAQSNTQPSAPTADGASANDYISRTDVVYQSQVLTNKTWLCLPAATVSKDMLTGTYGIRTLEYDGYYNPVRAVENFNGNGSKTVVTTVENNLSGYYIGRPIAVATTLDNGTDVHTSLEELSYNGFLPAQIRRKGHNTPFVVEDFNYDSFGNVLNKTITVAGGAQRSESAAFDQTGRFRLLSTDADGMTTTFVPDPATGLLQSRTNPFGQTETYTYDTWGRMLTSTNYLGKSTYKSYDRGFLGRTAVAETNDEGRTNVKFITALGQDAGGYMSTVTGSTIAIIKEYDVHDQLYRESQPAPLGSASQWDYTQYDEYGRVKQTTSFTGKVTNISYSGLSVTVNDGTKSVTTTKNALGQVASIQDPGGTVNYGYFANGNLRTADYQGIVQVIEQDGWGRKTKLTDPSSGTYEYEYDGFGQTTKETTPKGITQCTYDAAGKLSTKQITGDAANMQYAYTYNTSTKLVQSISLTNADGNNTTYSYSYDNDKRLINSVEDNLHARFAKSLTYDSFGRISTETNEARDKYSNITAQKTIEMQYAHGELLQSSLQGSGQIIWKVSGLNDRGQINTVNQGSNLRTTSQYDTYGLPQLVTIDKLSGSPYALMSLGYNFDGARGLVNSRTNSAFSWSESFSYDSFDRLTAFNDNNGNFSQIYDNRGRITQNSQLGEYAYDNNSYRQSELNYLVPAADTYYQARNPQQITYNAFKAPVDIIEPGHEKIGFQYNAALGRSHMYYGDEQADPLQRRFRRHYAESGNVEITNDLQSGTTTFIFYLGGDAYAAPAIIKSQFTGAGNSENLYFLHRDHLGSIVLITNEQGDAVEKRQFDAWGNVVRLTDGAGNNLAEFAILDRGFTGHEHLARVGLIHMNARLYDPKLHRFLAPDDYIQEPFNSQNYNRYAYGLNNPMTYTDPTGKFFWVPIIIGAIVGAYTGGTLANNGQLNPFKWDYSSGKTWGYMLGGAIAGGLSGWAGGSIASSGGAFANTSAIAAGSSINSFGTFLYTGGETDFSVNFGIGSFNFSTGELDFLGKKGNSLIENIGFALGAVANIQDVLAGFHPGNAQIQTENTPTAQNPTDKIGHFQVLDEQGNSLIDYGPFTSRTGRYFGFSPGRNDWVPYATSDIGPQTQAINIPGNLHTKAIPIKGVNLKTLAKISSNLNKQPGSYNFILNSCSSVGSRALISAGYFAIGGIHPYFIRTSILLREWGLRPSLYSHFINN